MNTLRTQAQIQLSLPQGSESLQAIFNGDQPEHYVESYRSLKKYIDMSLDQYKEDLQSILFPIFVHLFLKMIQSKFYEEAK